VGWHPQRGRDRSPLVHEAAMRHPSSLARMSRLQVGTLASGKDEWMGEGATAPSTCAHLPGHHVRGKVGLLVAPSDECV
jgi:hypothetical protein